mgnify:CR=1 FL=1
MSLPSFLRFTNVWAHRCRGAPTQPAHTLRGCTITQGAYTEIGKVPMWRLLIDVDEDYDAATLTARLAVRRVVASHT